MADYRLYVTNSSRERIARIDDWQQLTMLLKFNDVGKWDLELPEGEPAQLLTRTGGIAVERDGAAFFSGSQVDRRGRSWRASTGAHKRRFAGSDDNCYLARPLALPVPSGPPYSAQAYDAQGPGAAETLLKHYVEVNLGPSATAARRIAGLTIEADAGLGSTVSDWARFDTLLGLLQDLALRGGGLGFRVAWTGAGLEFQVYEPEDVSDLVVFSMDNGTLSAIEVTEDAPAANYCIAGGSGDGTARVFVETGDSSSIVRWKRRVERFVDQPATADTGELFKACTEELTRSAERISITLEPTETAGLRAFAHYNLGDTIRVDLPDQSIVDIVRGIEITVTPDGETIKPVIGSPESLAAASPLAGTFAKMRDLESRISALERR